MMDVYSCIQLLYGNTCHVRLFADSSDYPKNYGKCIGLMPVYTAQVPLGYACIHPGGIGMGYQHCRKRQAVGSLPVVQVIEGAPK
jgi:hypothetical protein